MTEPNKDDFLASLPLAANIPPLPGSAPPFPPLPPSVPHYTTEENAVASALVAAVRPDLAAFVDAVPEVDRGYINPIDSTAVLAANPEEAAAVQGIEAPEPPPPDDLDDMTRDQLKALGVVMGAFPSSTRMREVGMRSAIRAKRARAAFEAPGEPLDEVAEPFGPEPSVSTDEPEAEALVDLQTESTWEQYQRVQSGPEPVIMSTLNEAADLLVATKAKVDEAYDRGYVSGFEAGVRVGEAISESNMEEVNFRADIQRIADTMGCEITLTFRPKTS